MPDPSDNNNGIPGVRSVSLPPPVTGKPEPIRRSNPTLVMPFDDEPDSPPPGPPNLAKPPPPPGPPNLAKPPDLPLPPTNPPPLPPPPLPPPIRAAPPPLPQGGDGEDAPTQRIGSRAELVDLINSEKATTPLVTPTPPPDLIYKQDANPVVVAVANLFTGGLGYLLIGQQNKGILAIVITVVSSVVCVGPMICAAIFAYDGYLLAERLQKGEGLRPKQNGLDLLNAIFKD